MNTIILIQHRIMLSHLLNLFKFIMILILHYIMKYLLCMTSQLMTPCSYLTLTSITSRPGSVLRS